MNPTTACTSTVSYLAGFSRSFCVPLILFQVAANVCHAGGTVACWGANDSAQSQPPAQLMGVTAIAAGPFHSLALKSDGTVAGWGSNLDGESIVPGDLTNITGISAGGNFGLALKADGTVLAWGAALANPPQVTGVKAIAAGWSHALALKADGTLVSWGSQSFISPLATNVIAIAAGNGQSLALREDGTVVAWGDDNFGKAEVPAGLINVVAIAAGADHCLALRKDGSVIAWGRNDTGQATVPPNLGGVVAIAAGSFHSVALKLDGSVVAWGSDGAGQVSGIPAGNASVGIAASGDHSLAIIGDGSPAIVLGPTSQTVNHLMNATFTVTALGQSPLAYQWQRGGTNLSGATSSILVIPAVQPMHRGWYSVIVTNALGSVTSSPALLTIGGLTPQIISAFQDTNANCGDSVTLQVQAQGPSSVLRLFYQWEFQGVPIENATSTNLTLTNLTTAQSGQYTVVVTNIFGTNSASAVLTVMPLPPQIISPLTASAVQGVPFQYTIQATHTPASFDARFLPAGLAVDPNTGVISGTPLESGRFGPVLSAANTCATGTGTLMLNVASAAPVLGTQPAAAGTEGVPFQYQILANGANLTFGARNLPPGLTVNTGSGLISGTPVLAGEYFSAVSVSNVWGSATSTVHFTITNAPINGLSIGNVNYSYSAPYLLDFSFSLLNDNDPTIGNGVLADPRALTVVCFEDGVPISPSETGAFIDLTATKVTKAYLVLDFTESIASLANGDINNDGISDAVDSMVNGAIGFVDQQTFDTQVGVYEFHREDVDPGNVVGLTTDKTLVDTSIAGIWTNYVQGFPSSSRCWDAVMAAINGLGTSNRDEQHYIVLVSDGRDESSTNTPGTVMAAAAKANIQIFTLGFGAELDSLTLQRIAAQTQGRYYEAQNAAEIAQQLAQISKMARSQYVLRWATLKRSGSFAPTFQISYQGQTALSPTNTLIPNSTNVDTTVDPPVTNIVPGITNIIIADFNVSSNSGPVLTGSLRLVPNAEVQPTGIDLRATYMPRYIRQLRLHYRANWPCTVALQSTGPGELLSGWSLSQTNDGLGGNWLLLSSPYPQELTNSLPFASFGRLLTFTFQDSINSSNAFSVLEVDNSIYKNTGGQSFEFENTSSFLSYYPVLPHGTPILWLKSYGFSGNYTNAELQDPDQDGMANWQEFRANTNPKDATSLFLIRNVTRSPDGRYQVTFSTSTNRLYRVEASTDMTNWRAVQDSISGANSDVTITDTAYLPDGVNIFYRVIAH